MSIPVATSQARTRREAAKGETREALVRAGLSEFLERGLDVPSLDAICARAGYTRGAFYVHFRDRDDFVVAVMEWVLGGFLDAVLSDTIDGADLEATVDRFLEALLVGNPLTGERGSMRTHRLIDACVRSEKIRGRLLDILDGTRSRLARAVAESQQSGEVREDVRPEAVAGVLVALAMGVIQLYELGVPLAMDDLRETTLRLLKAYSARKKGGPA